MGVAGLASRRESQFAVIGLGSRNQVFDGLDIERG